MLLGYCWELYHGEHSSRYISFTHRSELVVLMFSVLRAETPFAGYGGGARSSH